MHTTRPNKRVDRTGAEHLRFVTSSESGTRCRVDVAGLTAPVGHPRRWALRMKTLTAVLLILTSVASYGSDQEYFSFRRWIERQCSTNTSLPEQRLFVGRMHSPAYADIIQFRKGVTIREIIDRSPLKGKTVKVCVMWPHMIAKSGSTFTRRKYITVSPSDNPVYDFKNFDVVWLHDEGPIIIR